MNQNTLSELAISRTALAELKDASPLTSYRSGVRDESTYAYWVGRLEGALRSLTAAVEDELNAQAGK